MGLLDMFDRIDDIVFAPVQAICDWVHEPLRRMEHKRELELQAQQEQNLIARMEAEAELQAKRRQWQIEMDQLIQEQEDARRDRLVEAVKRYQIELAEAIQHIVENVGLMSLALRKRANDLVLEKTKAYIAIQDRAKEQSKKELDEAKMMFAEDDPETYRMLVKQILEERQSMIDMAGKFIAELSEDLRRLNQNSDLLLQQGMTAVTEALTPLTASLALSSAAAPSQPALPLAEPQEGLILTEPQPSDEEEW